MRSHSPRLACECAVGIQSAQVATRARAWWLVALERYYYMPPRCLQRGKPRRCRSGDREHSTLTVTARAAGGLGLRRSVRHCAGGSSHADPGLLSLRMISIPSWGAAEGPRERLGRRRSAIERRPYSEITLACTKLVLRSTIVSRLQKYPRYISRDPGPPVWARRHRWLMNHGLGAQWEPPERPHCAPENRS